ncbi:DUF4397 domain-containing protein [Nocardioides sp. HM23]|uniref:DUF4397 domain-containing protein n=1 Tax=Nocardioides bizhenqiangii TaxID=3095076 RepID=UPI002ACADE5C|nr:DUF4397 domain-containing protein [Nocardioides sp. HM23]MDZ5621004.1 DUF4397 domain-containing protein [Nocardioides sp. HM23]
MVATRIHRPVLFLLALCLSGITWYAAADASAVLAKPGPKVYVVVGVLDPVDVTLDGETLENDVAPRTVLGPLSLAPGDHTVAFTAESWSTESTFGVDAPSTDVVVHRPADAAADPTVSVFTNDVSAIAPEKARLTVAHTAVVPPADVRVSGEVLFANIANGEFVTAEVPAQTYSVDIVATGEDIPVFGPIDLAVEAGALNRVFAIGQPEGGGMDAIVQVIPLQTSGGEPPESVDAGSVGLVDPALAPERAADDAGPSGVLILLLGIGAGLAVGAVVMRTRRNHALR